MDSPTPEVQIKRVVLSRMRRCSVCHREYEHGDIHVVSRKSDMWMMVVECEECHGRNFVAAVLNDGDADKARFALQQLSDEARDLSVLGGGLALEDGAPDALDTEASPAGPAVSAADVVDMHEFLGTFDGDFKRLFAGADDGAPS